nr:translation initiation factor IF-2-like [Pan paniscus]
MNMPDSGDVTAGGWRVLPPGPAGPREGEGANSVSAPWESGRNSIGLQGPPPSAKKAGGHIEVSQRDERIRLETPPSPRASSSSTATRVLEGSCTLCSVAAQSLLRAGGFLHLPGRGRQRGRGGTAGKGAGSGGLCGAGGGGAGGWHRWRQRGPGAGEAGAGKANEDWTYSLSAKHTTKAEGTSSTRGAKIGQKNSDASSQSIWSHFLFGLLWQSCCKHACGCLWNYGSSK